MSDDLTPIVIGVGDVVNRSRTVEAAIEPKDLILDAIRRAAKDAAEPAGTLLSSIDSIDVVASWTWPYNDLPGLISKELNIEPKHKHIPDYHGGNQPAKLFDEAARRISLGQAKVAVVCGGEALASLAACQKAGKLPPPGWTKIEQRVKSVFSPTNRELKPGLGALHKIGAPIQVYPLYENAFRAFRGQSIADNHKESAQLYSEFAKVAESNENAWNYGRSAKDLEAISTVSEKNRMICFPYPLLMNAFNAVNVAGACLLTSVGQARKFGIPKEKWIYALGGAGTRNSYDFWQRPNFYTSPCISDSIDAALQISLLTKDEIDIFDFYSCFPIVPKLACQHLGLSIIEPVKPITLLGGLTSFGGAGNNYSMHALTEMVRQLRKGKGTNGLILANGGVVTYQHVVCLSLHPRKNGPYPTQNALPEVLESKVPQIEEKPEGAAIIETYTVDYGRDGKPLRGHIVGKLENGNRFVANHTDDSTLMQLTSFMTEPIGRKGFVRHDSATRKNFFSFANDSKL